MVFAKSPALIFGGVQASASVGGGTWPAAAADSRILRMRVRWDDNKHTFSPTSFSSALYCSICLRSFSFAASLLSSAAAETRGTPCW